MMEMWISSVRLQPWVAGDVGKALGARGRKDEQDLAE